MALFSFLQRSARIGQLGAMLGANSVDDGFVASSINLEEISRVLRESDDNGVTSSFDRNNFVKYNSTPAPQVDFEIRHTREHLEKLKFNWLELHTKRTFLGKMSDGEEWKACQTSKWTPGELKQLERSVEPSKSKLKVAKESTVELQRRLLQACETINGVQDTVSAKHAHAQELARELVSEQETLTVLRAKLPTTAESVRSVEELQGILDEQSILLEKKASALERQKAAVADLERLLAVHEGENAKLVTSIGEMEEKRRVATNKGAGAEQMALTGLCTWYGRCLETLSKIGGVKVEMIQADYILVTVDGGVPVYIWVEPASGKLRAVKIGSTSATPKRQWREVIDIAIEYNDIPFLLRAIQGAIRNKN